MCATFTYPIAVRIAKKIFHLKGFYAIHLAIAPFLALAHVNIFAIAHMWFRIKLTEIEFDELKHLLPPNKDYSAYQQVYKQIMRRYTDTRLSFRSKSEV